MTIHDHFDGCAHCIECEGPCKLKGDDLEITRLFRSILESYAFNHGDWLPSQLADPMMAIYGSNWRKFRQRALDTGKGRPR